MSRHNGNLSTSLLAAFLFLGVVPACSASGPIAPVAPQTAVPGGSGTIVYRPVFPLLREPRPVFLSGYAGTTYPPLGSGARLSPTGYWTTNRVPTAPCAPRRWWRP
jgi:hypothetical protein